MKKRNLIIGFVLLLGIIILIQNNFVSAVGENTYCAERTTNGAWCQNVPLKEVDQNYRSVPTSCEATSYCKLGTCVNSQEGTCLENTPQKVCEKPQDGVSGGVWFDKSPDEIPQCSLGCCILGEQASFVTQTRCKQLSSLYGLNTNYRTDIKSEVACIVTATSKVKGACVFKENSEKTCKFTTRGECQGITGKNSSSTFLENLLGDNKTGIVNGEFHAGILCSAEELATNCGPSKKTTLIDGKDEVYFVDTCGNPANIYDASKINDKSYWRTVVKKADSCGFGNANGNAGSATCGNCNYFEGSTGKKYERDIDPVSPVYGDNICRSLNCEYKGKEYKHGETWCSTPAKEGKNLPGSRYSRLVCYDGDVTVEPCAAFRQEVCVQSEVNNFKTAACIVNKWQDCTSQKNQQDCKNTDKRDCSWVLNKCVPKYPPGFNFWKSGGSAKSLCSVADNKCVVKYKKGIFGDWKCSQNCQCLDNGWAQKQNNLCVSLGDCGSAVNYKGYQGYYSISDAITKSEGSNTKSQKSGG